MASVMSFLVGGATAFSLHAATPRCVLPARVLLLRVHVLLRA